MIRTQIQLPEELHRRVKRVAAAQGWTLAETMRHAAERLLESYSPERLATPDSRLPAPMALGKFLSDAEDRREPANAGAGSEAVIPTSSSITGTGTARNTRRRRAMSKTIAPARTSPFASWY